ncbi:MAG: hypothetical protein H6888_14860 [Nitratireductor sp.]|jgi:hypothetical protein|nr:hypothetical protein [Nitratireductor sp.]MCC0022344.1 hypothetical protein [Nitratireductor sp.]
MSFFGNLGKRMIEAREREARRHVSNVLLSLDDASLNGMGLSRHQLKRDARGAHSSVML